MWLTLFLFYGWPAALAPAFRRARFLLCRTNYEAWRNDFL